MSFPQVDTYARQQGFEIFSKHMTFDAFTTFEGRRFQMSTIRIENNHFLMLKFAC